MKCLNCKIIIKICIVVLLVASGFMLGKLVYGNGGKMKSNLCIEKIQYNDLSAEMKKYYTTNQLNNKDKIMIADKEGKCLLLILNNIDVNDVCLIVKYNSTDAKEIDCTLDIKGDKNKRNESNKPVIYKVFYGSYNIDTIEMMYDDQTVPFDLFAQF